MNREEPMAELPDARTWQQTIDRLVDGELSDAESRELLAMLDGIDGGWRRLALAYVETQWLRSELPSLVHAGPASREEPAAMRPVEARASKGTQHPRLALMALAVAASMLAAFGLTLWQRGTGVTMPADPASPVATQPAIAHPQLAKQPSHVPAVAIDPASDVSFPPSNKRNTVPSSSVAGHKSSPEPRMVVIGSDEELRGADATTVPPQVIEALRRMGHRVYQRSGVMPVRLKDGRRVNVPYDQVDVQYRGAATFQ